MTGTLSYMDYLASSGRTPWHRASALSKMALLGALIAAVLAARSPAGVGALFGLAWLLALTARLPLRVAAAAIGYPLVFSALYALSHLDGTWGTPLATVLRALTACLGAVWLVATTPYPDLFAPLARALPRPVGDGLFLTYRAFFALLTRAEHLWRALRLRGGSLRAPRVVGEGLGTLVLHSFERSERLYGAMRLRGHGGRVCGCRHFAEWTAADLLPAALALLLLAGAWAGWTLR